MVAKKDILHPKDIQRTFTITLKKLTFFTFLLQIYLGQCCWHCPWCVEVLFSIIFNIILHMLMVFFFSFFKPLSLSKFGDVFNILSNKLKMLKGPLAFCKSPQVLIIYLMLPTWWLMLLECCSTLLDVLQTKAECLLPIACHFEHFFTKMSRLGWLDNSIFFFGHPSKHL